MLSLLANWMNNAWFPRAVLCAFLLLGALIGYFSAQQFNPVALILIFAIIGLVCNHFTFGTMEMYVFVVVWTIFAAILCPIIPLFAVAITGFVAALFAAFVALSWMDEPNKIAAMRQAQIEQRNLKS